MTGRAQQGAHQDSLLQLMDQATQMRRQGDVFQALTTFRGLKDTPSFKYIGYAWQQYALCLVQIGQTDQALSEFKELAKSYKEKTLIRAHILLHTAQISIALSEYGSVEKFLAEAKEIFAEQGEFFYVGIIKQLEGNMAQHQEKVDEALQLIAEGSRMTETYRITSPIDLTTRSQSQLISAAG
jgi:tetratricopeptide (TPR) repeat protein